MVGARHLALGGANPAINNDINGALINPASIAGIQSMPLALSYRNYLGSYQYQLVNVGLPYYLRFNLRKSNERLQQLNFSANYGSYTMSEIPETVCNGLISDGCPNIQQTGNYSGGVQIGSVSMGTQFYDFFGFNTFSIGVNTKYYRQFLSGNQASQYTTFGFDSGFISSKLIDLWQLDQIHFGVSFHNIFSPPATNSKTSNEILLPFSFLFGTKLDMFNESLSVYATKSIDKLSISTEYFLLDSIFLRGTTTFDSFRLGTGIVFNDVAIGFGQHNYSIRLDYAYEYPKYPINTPSHMFSVSILGDSRPNAPRILNPETELLITDQSRIDMRGLGPKNTTIRIFRNDAMIRTAVANKFGKWTAKDLELVPNKNLIYVQSYSLNKDTSHQSFPILIYSDIGAPEIRPYLSITDDKFKLYLDINEDLATLTGLLNNQIPLEFTKQEQLIPTNLLDAYMQPTRWIAEFPIPNLLKPNGPVSSEMMTLSYVAEDLAGNKSQNNESELLLSVLFPQDQYVHYKPSLRIIGKLSSYIKSLTINQNPIYIDKRQQFAVPIDLDPGKNLIRFNLELNDIPEKKTKTEVSYTMRVLRLISYPDVTSEIRGRREIEFLSTLNLLFGESDGNFYPNAYVTRDYLARLLVMISGVTVSETVETDLFGDVPASHPNAPTIKAAVENGLLFAFPDGSFRPDQQVTLSESLFLLSNAGLINTLDSDTYQNRYITRAELAESLAYLPEFESQIESLINWDSGYLNR